MPAVLNHEAEGKSKAVAGRSVGSSVASSQLSEFGSPAWLNSGERKALVS